ncbi:hypothetical protein [Kitasatospora purpeofusca]|uniref:hypothetical protein n=1 Tax=Kitasatospora purpeofusca TaxID=67352 RepID=UPI0022522603|nr:hypothetical protein [Kitasatospora purpeofusca]MCX4756999.1 hypothetical protein [Kitasatospora purpeofusca]WSR35234.1 hypothetical protein OG715_32315 [Kitasatospora purpeofusca]
MSRYDLASEGRRLRGRPPEDPISLLGLLVVTPAADGLKYAQRLRDLIAGAVEISSSANFESDDVSEDTLPSWFLSLSDGELGDAPGDSIGSKGKRRYLEVRDDRPWNSGDWIYCFDPDLRAWSWWDVTIDENGKICVWVDTKGEAHIPCEELWWAIFVSGAASVEPLTLELASAWSGQRSIGLEK